MIQHKVGLTLGKFAPLHKGHQYMIETALLEMDELIIFIYNADESDIPLNVRAGWLRKLYPQAIVYEAWDGPQEVGDTIEIKRVHERYIIERLEDKKVTHFYSSEFYGRHMSLALGALNRQVDVNREKYPVSATMIRKDPFTHRKFINPLVYKDHITKVVFLGAPSTGKSTITEKLAYIYKTVFMPEYGREYWEKHQQNRRLEPEQLVEIAKGHIEREEQLVTQANKYFFVDTNAITTYMFAQYYHEFALPELELLALKAKSNYDLIFLCGDDIPYENTWDRSGDVKRHTFQEHIMADLEERKIPYIKLRGTLEERINKVKSILNNFDKYSTDVSL